MARKPDPEIDPAIFLNEAIGSLYPMQPRDKPFRPVLREIINGLCRCADKKPLRQSDVDRLYALSGKACRAMEK
jgi:hypothetical protein